MLVFTFLYLFLLGVNGLGGGFQSLGGGLLDSFFRVTSNPFVGLIIGLLTTTIVQSSSVTTSLIVGLVAAPQNPLPIANAVPMVMGANIGTTVTATIVSLAHITRPAEFRRAFAVATCHDMFNVFSVLILLPLEIATGYLRHTAEWISAGVSGIGGVTYHSPIKAAMKAGLKPIEAGITAITGSAHTRAVLLIIVSVVLIYAALALLVRTMRSVMKERMEGAVFGILDRSPLFAMMVGLTVTAIIQSSSITTSLLVPLGGAGLITLEQAFPVTIGANVGTTLTAMMASLAVTGPNAQAGISIALVHLLFNLTGTVIIYPIRKIRNIPLGAARGLATMAVKRRWLAVTCVAVAFYALPLALAWLSR